MPMRYVVHHNRFPVRAILFHGIASFAISGLIGSGRTCSSQGLNGFPQPGRAGLNIRDDRMVQEDFVELLLSGALPK
jgi:hypothetical protein